MVEMRVIAEREREREGGTFSSIGLGAEGEREGGTFSSIGLGV